ncbi:MAG TPA: hypothetical protein VGF56_09640 [Rhizomicrobium sp.]|jgi:hypothetical protein
MTTTVIFPGGATRSVLNALIAHLEPADGPLTGMRIDGTSTLMDFEETAARPTVYATLQPSSEPAPADAKIVCSARIYMAGEQVDCTAYRVE